MEEIGLDGVGEGEDLESVENGRALLTNERGIIGRQVNLGLRGGMVRGYKHLTSCYITCPDRYRARYSFSSSPVLSRSTLDQEQGPSCCSWGDSLLLVWVRNPRSPSFVTTAPSHA